MYQIFKKSYSFWFIFILIFSTFITYFNTLPNQLFFDDEELIYKNMYVQNLKYLPHFFTENMVAGAGKMSNMYRPILLSSFSIDWNIWRGNPVGFHVTSILLHTINTLLVYFLILLLFNDSIISFLTAILFSVHPAISEAIIYASGRTDPLYSMFTLLSLIFFLLFIKSKNKLFYFFSFLCFLLSLGSKETAVITPFLITICYFSFKVSLRSRAKRERSNLLFYEIATSPDKNRSPRNDNLLNFRKLFSLFLPFFTLTAMYIISRLTFLNFSNSINFYKTQTIYSSSILIRALTFCRAFFDYLFLFFFPKDLMIARGTPIISSFFNFYVILFLLILLILIFLMIKTKNNFLIFGICWFFISILPVSGIIPINNITAEHYLYLPSIGFFLLLSYIFKIIFQKTSGTTRVAFILFLILILSLLSFRTILRTFDFRDSITFYTKSLEQTPGHIPMMNNLAMAYDEKGEKKKAKGIYKLIIRSHDVYPNVHHNLGILYESEGKFKEAEEEYTKALFLDPNFIFSKNALKDLENKKNSL